MAKLKSQPKQHHLQPNPKKKTSQKRKKIVVIMNQQVPLVMRKLKMIRKSLLNLRLIKRR